MFHKFEEPIISGNASSKGSGAIFFSGCNLKCVFCQNYPISHSPKGKVVSVKKLVKIFKWLERHGALNINLVTPSHFSLQIISALKIYKPQIPVVWNSNGYESETIIEMLRGLVDVFLVDLKYQNDDLAIKYSSAPNYKAISQKAILKMRDLQPKDVIVDGLIKQGVIIRHLILPTHTDDSIRCMDWIYNNLGKDTIVSIMSQYEPMYDACKFEEINRKITKLEYKRVENYAITHDMLNCYTQDLSSANTKYTPKF